MERETHKEYLRRLRAERDNPILQKRATNISHRPFTYFVKNPDKTIQPIPYSQIRNHDTVHIRHSFWAATTPKEQAFLLKRQINSNIIFKNVLEKANHPPEDIQPILIRIQQLKEQLNKIIC